MSQSSARLTLPFIQAAQAQKHVTHNEAVRALDLLVQLSFEDDATSAPPPAPGEGQCYIVASGGSGAWSGQDGAIAIYLDGAWQFHTPRAGWRGYVLARAAMTVFDGTHWQEISPNALQAASLIGLGMQADGSTPFAAKLNAALWSALYSADGGTGSLIQTLNKESSAHDAGLVLQEDFQTRALIGLFGSNNLRFSVTPDGVTFNDALSIDPATGMRTYHCREIAFGLGLEGDQIKSATKFLLSMYKAFIDLDASMVEINPLVVTGAGEVIALDAKMNFDDNALYRHKDYDALRDLHEEEETEIEASKYGLSFIKLDGTIGCMVNGAGLAMGTMDIIKLYGGEPANFLDVGGGATKEKVTEAFKVITSDPQVKGILVNIFGGIMRCDVIAEGVVAAVKEVGLKVPLVVRLEGTNVEAGKEIINTSGLDVIAADNLSDGAEKIVKAVKG